MPGSCPCPGPACRARAPIISPHARRSAAGCVSARCRCPLVVDVPVYARLSAPRLVSYAHPSRPQRSGCAARALHVRAHTRPHRGLHHHPRRSELWLLISWFRTRTWSACGSRFSLLVRHFACDTIRYGYASTGTSWCYWVLSPRITSTSGLGELERTDLDLCSRLCSLQARISCTSRNVGSSSGKSCAKASRCGCPSSVRSWPSSSPRSVFTTLSSSKNQR